MKTLISKLKWYLVSFLLGVGVTIGLYFENRQKSKTAAATKVANQLKAIEAMKPPVLPLTQKGKIEELRRRGLVK